MITLIFSVCLVSNPTICHDERIPIIENISVARCTMRAAPQMAQWIGDNPEWRVIKWRCAPPGEKDA